MTTLFLCDEDPDSIFTAIYEAYASRLGHSRTGIRFRENLNRELFCSYVEVTADPVKANSVIRSIKEKISYKAWIWLYRAALSDDPMRADDIYRFLKGGYYYGSRVTSMLTAPEVIRIQELDRYVGNEAHFYREFIRFDQMQDSILLARIRPKSNVLSLVTPHFADRIPDENFMILDVDRSMAAVHPAQKDPSLDTRHPANWYLTSLTEEECSRILRAEQDEYRDLWKAFYDAIAIKERLNPALQRNRMPLRYREFAPEFQ